MLLLRGLAARRLASAAVARPPLGSLAFARRLSTLAEQPAVGGGTFTPLNLPPQGYMHGDAIYVAAIDQYAIVSQSGDRKQNFFSSASSDFFYSGAA